MLVKIKIQFSGNDICGISNYIDVDEFKFDQHFAEFDPHSWEVIGSIHPGLSEYISKISMIKNRVDKIQSVVFQKFFGEKFEL